MLLYRGSRDLFKSEKFREHCRDKGATFNILKTKSRDRSIIGVCGGFTDIPWSN